MNEVKVIFIKPFGMKGERTFKQTLNNGKINENVLRKRNWPVFLCGSHISLLKQLLFHLIFARSAVGKGNIKMAEQ